MKKLSMLLWAAAVMMLPMTTYADTGSRTKTSQSKSKSKSKKSTKKTEVKEEIPEPVPEVKEAVVEFSSEQVMLNNQAVEAGEAGDYKKAEQLFTAMLQIQEMNIIWLNLGGVLSKEGKCIEAKEAFENVFTAPKITAYPTETIENQARILMDELKAQCSARIVLDCKPADMTIAIDNGKEFKCHTKPLSVTPGSHLVYGKTSYGFNSETLSAIKGQTTTFPIEVIDYKEDFKEDAEKTRKQSKLFKALGYSFIGVGAGIAAGGGALLGVSYNDYKDKIDAYNKNPGDEQKSDVSSSYDSTRTKLYISYGMLGLGGAMLVTGIVLVVYDAAKLQPKLREYEERGILSWHLSPTVSPEFSGFVLNGSF